MSASRLTVEEAAERLGVSPATVRRRAASGELAAEKAGKQWVIDGAFLPTTQRARRKRSASYNVTLALRHVKNRDLADEWVPDVLRHADELEDSDALIRASEAQLRADGFNPAIDVEVDKSPIFTRPSSLLQIVDRVSYQAVVSSFADRVEAQTPDEVFSARLSKDSRYFTKRGPQQWALWQSHVLAKLEGGHKWMVATDLTSYFNTISHELLLSQVEALNTDPETVETLREMLSEWAPVPGMGLPQGPDASRLLANLFLLPVDRAMLDAGWSYSRFMDDIRITTSTREEGVRAIRQFQDECGRRGLIVSSSKTELLSGVNAKKALGEDKKLGAAQYLMDANAANLARRELKTILKRALKNSPRINSRHVRFTLWRLVQLRDGGAIGQVLKNLGVLSPLATVVAGYLQPFISRKRVVDGITAFLDNPNRSYSTYITTWVLAAMSEHPGTTPPDWTRIARDRLRDRNQPSYLRAAAALVMIQGRDPADAQWAKREITREHDPTVVRGLCVGLASIGELDEQVADQAGRRSPALSATVKYLNGRTTRPSLISKNGRVRMAPRNA